tara:strand:- start:1 stop:231 length:231 start_codon:yes stop_codon:yes gene_type:complete
MKGNRDRTCDGVYENSNGLCSILVCRDESSNVVNVMCVYRYRDRCDNLERYGEIKRDPKRPETYGIGQKRCRRLEE